MPDGNPNLPMLPAGIPPEDYAPYLESLRRQQLAGALMGQTLSPLEAPQTAPVRGLYVQPRVGGVQAASKLASALLARQAQDSAIREQIGALSSMDRSFAPGGQQTSPGTPLQAAPQPAPGSSSQDVQPLVQRLPGASLAQTVQATQPTYAPQNPRNPQGLPADVVRNLALYKPDEYAKMLQGPEAVQLGRIAGLDPGTAASAAFRKATTLEGRPGASATDYTGRTTINADPSLNVSFRTNPDGSISAIPIAGEAELRAQAAGQTTAQTAANTPHYEPDPFHPGQVRVQYPPPGPALSAPGVQSPAGPPAPGASSGAPPGAPGSASVAPLGAPQAPHPAAPPSTGSQAGNTALALEQQKTAGKAGAESGQAYSDQLNKNATSATEVRRSLAELKNLSASAAPGTANPAKLEAGSYMVAMGMDPKRVSGLLGVDIDALTAASKQTGSLALDSIHDMTSRGTNFDLATFMRYNPNLNMATPGGFARVLDFMDKRMQQEVAKQADFNTWSQSHPRSDQWASGHTAHWLELQNQLIDAGKTNSRRPLSAFDQPQGTP